MTTYRPRPMLIAMVLVLALCAPLAMLPARAAGAATTLKFDGATPTKTKGIVTLDAILTGPDRKPLNKRPVAFYEQVDLMGPREALIGTVETDSTGTAELEYQPADSAERTIIARFAGDANNAASEGRGTVQVKDAVAPYPAAAEPLAVPAWLLPRVLGLLIVLMWLLLFGVFVSTARGIRRSGRGATPSA